MLEVHIPAHMKSALPYGARGREGVFEVHIHTYMNYAPYSMVPEGGICSKCKYLHA